MKLFLVMIPVVAVTGFACGSSKTPSTNTCVAPAAAPAVAVAPACAGQMYAKYGQAGFTAVNTAIVNGALTASTADLGTSFKDKLANASSARQTQFTGNLAAFLISAFGGPNNYVGPDLKAVHAPLKITSAQYDKFITDVVVPALSSSGVAMTDITNCFAPVVTDPGFKGLMVTCQ